MHQLPKLKWKPKPCEKVHRLARWLQQWKWSQEGPDNIGRRAASIRHTFDLNDPEVAEQIAERLTQAAKTDPAPEAGQIRLLSSAVLPSADRPVYVALLNDSGSNTLLVVPFGPFLEPATTTEWLTGRDAGALSVLCLWNARTLPKEVLLRSWFVDTLTVPEQTDALAVFRHAATGADLEDRLLSQVGCTITKPNDPRLAYQAQELRLFTPAPPKPEQSPAARRRGNIEFYLPWKAPSESEEIVLQARSRAPGSLEYARYAVGETPLVLTLLTRTDGKQVEVSILDQRENPSPDLDGAQVIPREGEAVRIANGRALCQRDAVLSGFGFLGANGKPINLRRLE
jgi:hypothetical protein